MMDADEPNRTTPESKGQETGNLVQAWARLPRAVLISLAVTGLCAFVIVISSVVLQSVRSLGAELAEGVVPIFGMFMLVIGFLMLVGVFVALCGEGWGRTFIAAAWLALVVVGWVWHSLSGVLDSLGGPACAVVLEGAMLFCLVSLYSSANKTYFHPFQMVRTTWLTRVGGVLAGITVIPIGLGFLLVLVGVPQEDGFTGVLSALGMMGLVPGVGLMICACLLLSNFRWKWPTIVVVVVVYGGLLEYSISTELGF